MAEHPSHKEHIVDADVLDILKEFWTRERFKPSTLQYLYIAGSAVNGGRAVVRREAGTLDQSDIDITYVASPKNNAEFFELQSFMKKLIAFFEAKRKQGKIEFSDIQVLSSRLLDYPPPDKVIASVEEAAAILETKNVERIAKVICQLCYPTIPAEAGIQNKKFVAVALQMLSIQSDERYQRVVLEIKSEWQRQMRWKAKYAGENTNRDQYLQSDHSESLAANLINSVSKAE